MTNRWDEGLLDMCIGEKRYADRPSYGLLASLQERPFTS